MSGDGEDPIGAAVRRLVSEVWNGEREQAAYELIHPDHPTLSSGVRGADGVLGLRWRGTGSQRGQFGPVPPTGRSVEYEGATFLRFADGKVRETWSVNDLFGMLRQLGVQVIPPERGADTGTGTA